MLTNLVFINAPECLSIVCVPGHESLGAHALASSRGVRVDRERVWVEVVV